MPTALTIAGFDPSSGAGVTADLMVFAAHGIFGTSCITALTVQNTLGVRRVEPVDATTITDTLRCLQDDLPPLGIKIGMLATAANVSAVAAFLRDLRRYGRLPVVLDPVLQSSSGRGLLDEQGLDRMRRELLPEVDWVTPNLEELRLLASGQVASVGDAGELGHDLQRLGQDLKVVVTGGDQERPDDLLLQPFADQVVFPGERITTRSTHGTGCAFSSRSSAGSSSETLTGGGRASQTLRHRGSSVGRTARSGQRSDEPDWFPVKVKKI